MDKLLCIITGPERNGTTYVEKIICSHPDLFCGFETGILLNHDFSKSKPFCEWIYHRGFHWGLRKDIKLDDDKSFQEKYDLLFKYKGSYHKQDKIQKLIYDSRYIVDKTPAYIRNFEFVHKNVPDTIPIIVIIKNFRDNIISKVIKRNRNIKKVVEEIELTIDCLKYIKNNKSNKNIYVFYYNDVMDYNENFLRKIEDILKYKIDTNVQLSLEKYNEKLKEIEINEPYKDWKFTEFTLDDKIISKYKHIETKYDNLIKEIKEQLETRTMKYILTNIPKYIIDSKYDELLSPEMPSESIVKIFGLNTGNCMFWESTKTIINNQTNLELLNLSHDFRENKNHYKNKIEMVVIVLANNISPMAFSQCNVYANSIKDLNCKKYLFSIGAQSSTLEFRKFSDQEKKTYLNFLSCFEYAFLRGQYTYDLLKYNDIPLTNCEVVGCPSILLEPVDTDEMKIKFEKLKKQNVDEIKIGINYPGHRQHLKLRKHFVCIMHDPNVYTLAVNDPRMYDFINKGKSFPLFKYSDEKNIEKNRNNFIFSGNVFESIEFFRNNANLMIGTRIHGTILGLMAGLPSMCLVIDSRTYELCEQMRIPYINCIEKTIEFQTKEELLQIFLNNFDATKLDGLKEVIDKNKKKYLIS